MKDKTITSVKKLPVDKITIAYVEVVLMPNGEALHAGKSFGFLSSRSSKQFVFVEAVRK